MNTTNFDNAFDRFCDDGYRPTGDREKQRIEFRKDGESFCLQLDQDYPELYRLSMPNFWLMADQDDWLSAKRAAMHVNRTIKCACVNVSEKYDSAANASVKTDLLCDNFETFWLVWERAVKTLHAARNEFAKALREIQDAD